MRMGKRKRDDYKFLPLRDAHTCMNQKVNFMAVVLEYGFPKPTKGTDFCCSLRVIDESHHQTGMAVNIFAENEERVPLVAAVGDVIQLCHVVVRSYDGEVNAVFNKKFSSFALYDGKDSDEIVPYHVSSKFYPIAEDKMFIDKLRKWLVNFQLQEDSSNFPMLREIKEENHINLVCKILHSCEAPKDEWCIFAWDGTDIPPNAICSKLEDEMNSPLPLQLEHLPLPRELLCTLPAVGSILRITCELGLKKSHLQLLNAGKWVKFINMRLKVHAGLWGGVFTPYTKLRYTPDEDRLIVERQRLSDERLSLKSGRMPFCHLPEPSCITEVYKGRSTPAVTLMTVLTHPNVPARFKCVVRVVAAMPCQAESLLSPARKYRMRLTLEDSTARIHAFVAAEDGETLFYGFPDIDKLTKKLHRLLGVAECDGSTGVVKDTPRNPPWVCICLKSYYVSKTDVTDVWVTRHFRIWDTKIVGDI